MPNLSLSEPDLKRKDADALISLRSPLSTLCCSQLAQEVDHGGVDFGRTLLLGPVTAAGEHDLSAQSRHVVC